MKLEEAIQSTKFKDEKHKATINVLYAAYWLKTRVSACIKDYGITLEQFNVMRILRGKHPEKMCVKNIGSRMIEKSSNVPRIIDRLEAKNLVERETSPEDKRESLISLTAEGIALIEKASNAMDDAGESMIGITNEDAKMLNTLLDKMRKVD